MRELQEIVEVGAVERLFRLLAVAGPLAGLMLGALLGARRAAALRGAGIGLLAGLACTLNWLLWCLFNRLTDRNGLDSTVNLAQNLVLFVLAGALLGYCIARAGRRSDPQDGGAGRPPAP